MARALFGGIGLIALIGGLLVWGPLNTSQDTMDSGGETDAQGALNHRPETAASTRTVSVKTEWITDYDEGLKKASEEGRPILIDAWANWCSSCKLLWKNTFLDSAVQQRLERFVRIKLDMDEQKNAVFWDKYGMKGLPWVGFLTHEGRILKEQTLLDYEPPEAFLKRLDAVDEILPPEGPGAVQ